MSTADDGAPPPSGPKPPGTPVIAELLAASDPARFAYLAENRGLVVRRSLLATALGGIIPLPVMDDYVAGRVRAGLFIKLASARHVDLPQSSADLLSDPKDGSTLRNATITAATLIALKLAWRKFFALLAAGRGADEMATTFQFATIVDHYCARVHTGGAVGRQTASELRLVIHACIDRTEKAKLVSVFREGARTLGRSVLEAPRWMSDRLNDRAQQWVSTGGRTAFDPAADLDVDPASDRWLDRATRLVEDRLSGLGNDYLGSLLDDFDRSWQARPKKAGGEGVAEEKDPPKTPQPP